jgi:hypothetical protein
LKWIGSYFVSKDLSFLGVKLLGINYGQVGNPFEKVLNLLSSLKLNKRRMYDINLHVLTAFTTSNIELVFTIENELVA